MHFFIKCESQLDVLLIGNAPESQLQCFAFQEQDKGPVTECLCRSSESPNIVSGNYSQIHSPILNIIVA